MVFITFPLQATLCGATMYHEMVSTYGFSDLTANHF